MPFKTTTEQELLLQKFAELVESANRKHNLTSAKTAKEFYETHVADCVAAYASIKDRLEGLVVDCGSGAGLPAIVWAILNPNRSFLSIDSNQKKIAFQKTAKRALGLDNLTAEHKRVEDLNIEEQHSLVFKAFSSISKAAAHNKKNNKSLHLKKDDEKTKQEISEVGSLLYDYKRHSYTVKKTKMLVVEIYDGKNSNN
ncbi:MAG: 16S rRNA (guanine(527)-N(7))-methyltransferase RsmG [Gammaproteobacteria bacterium]|nr:16S rRNA (guanine(527)-N(7))-methyltransferase RsmG [Gammaproteobacteria bacterium]|tara:strand:- start:2955 stop:3548 length:594 start_codon:yes stop_codon:yes gene_type:complete